MMEKQYERTGVKERFYKREKQCSLDEKKRHQEEVQKAIKRGCYKEKVKDCYDLSIMNAQKEYKKVEELLEQSKDVAGAYHENIDNLIHGYIEYFNTYGNDMTAMALRDFRRGILSTVSNSKKALIKESSVGQTDSMQLLRDEVILDFCVNHHYELQENGLDIGMFTSLMATLIDEGISPKSGDDIAKVREKVKSIQNELKSS